jgi:OmpA-OmpF porin, OOP family
MKTSLYARLLGGGAIALALSACGSMTSQVSKNIADDGTPGELVFPAPEHALRRGGIYPNMENLRKVRPGMTKDQLLALVGPPHFREGMFAVREWDYILHLPTTGPAQFQMCQYKVLFDANMAVQKMYMALPECAALLASPVVAPTAAQIGAVPMPTPTQEPLAAPRCTPGAAASACTLRTFELSIDTLFAFDKSAVTDMLTPGLTSLDRLVDELAPRRVERLEVVGHADRLGTAAYNQALSYERAQAVLAYLEVRGLQARNPARAVGRGANEPRVKCAQTDRATLIACLAPNRRVVVDVLVSDAP